MLYNIIGGVMKIVYNYENHLNVIMTFIFSLFFLMITLIFVQIFQSVFKLNIPNDYYIIGIAIILVSTFIGCLFIFLNNLKIMNRNKKIMTNGDKKKGQLIKINGDYINGKIYYSIEIEVNGAIERVDNIKNTKFIREAWYKGGYIKNNLYFVDVYILDKDFYVDFKSIKQGREF